MKKTINNIHTLAYSAKQLEAIAKSVNFEIIPDEGSPRVYPKTNENIELYRQALIKGKFTYEVSAREFASIIINS